jgi:hypothetical protein
MSEYLGTEEDGGFSEEYCKFCYDNGKVIDEGITLKEKIEELVKQGVSQLGMTEDQARKLAETTLPQLKRWK